MIKSSMNRVDSNCNFGYTRLQLRLLCGGHSYLYQNDLIRPFSVRVEELLITQQLLTDPSHGIYLVTGDDEPLTVVTSQDDLSPVTDIGLLPASVPGIRVNTDRECAHIHETARQLNPYICGSHAQNSVASPEEMTSVLVQLKANQIGTRACLQAAPCVGPST